MVYLSFWTLGVSIMRLVTVDFKQSLLKKSIHYIFFITPRIIIILMQLLPRFICFHLFLITNNTLMTPLPRIPFEDIKLTFGWTSFIFCTQLRNNQEIADCQEIVVRLDYYISRSRQNCLKTNQWNMHNKHIIIS